MLVFKKKGLRSMTQEVLKTFSTLGSWKKVMQIQNRQKEGNDKYKSKTINEIYKKAKNKETVTKFLSKYGSKCMTESRLVETK